MRNDFVKQMLIEMKDNKNIIFLTADLGFNALEPLRESFPDRFFNIGIAEATMVGMAAGLALAGKKVIVYSIASFLTLRSYEQIRTDVCYHNLDVIFVGTGGGYNYSDNGVTHHTIEDLAIMSVLPNMRVLCPGYSWEASGATKALLRSKGPGYLRLGKSPGINYEKPNWKFSLGEGYVLKEGNDILLLTTGNLIERGIRVKEQIEKSFNFKVGVISIPSVKPLDKKLILKKIKFAKAIYIFEEHSSIGGLGSAVATLLAENNKISTLFKIFSFPDSFNKGVGNRDYLLDKVGLSIKAIVSSIKKQI